MTLTKIALAAGFFAIVAPGASFASQTSHYDRCNTPMIVCAPTQNQVGVSTTSYGELEAHGMNAATPPSLTPDGAAPSTKVIEANNAPQQVGHETATY
ncbi:MAG: hypothetical protein ABIN69_17765 [Aestuariivirga sp.]